MARGKKPYQERTDLEKIQSQWRKLSGLHTREEWSAAVIRSATAAELAANFAIRREFSLKSELSSEFVDRMLIWANGIAGKIDRLLIHLCEGQPHHGKVKKLKKIADEINAKRNAVAHQGKFCNEEEAQEVIQKTKEFVEELVQIYKPKFALE